MKEIVVVIAALIIILVTLVGVLLFCLEAIDELKRRKRENELKILRIDLKKGDNQAELKLNEQLIYLKQQVETARLKQRHAQKELDSFQRIYDLYSPSSQDKLQMIKIPKNLHYLSYEIEGEQESVHLMSERLEEFLDAQN